MQTFAPLSHKVTIADIARKLSIAPATVSRALNGHPAISEKTRKLVEKTARKLQYKRNNIASSLRSGKSNLIGVIIPSAEINFFGSVVHGIEKLANEKGYNVLIYQSNESREQEKKGLETFLHARVDGILVSIAKDTTDYEHFRDIQEQGIPIVFFDRAKEELNFPAVVVDDFKGGYAATEELLKQGFDRIAHISGPAHMDVFHHRLQGYKAALKAWKKEFIPELVVEGYVSIESGQIATEKLMALPHPPDAIFAVEDFTALGALKQLKAFGKRVPADIGVVGFANEMFGEHITPSLTTFDQQTVLMGKEATGLLLQLLGGDTNTVTQQKIMLEPIPVIRDSSRKTRQA
ncbi:LacI family DNA-binding transcriptional regulator [Pseudoflavitalea sp. G-6-1-2]|uniref:LacI family DNA-binding transcriptional regulator n=1 Tax=Pseudoflavitalea sp. G-6-1-2 TaxID=2728841 RepID=UPI003211DA47